MCVYMCVRQGQAVCSLFVLLAVGRAQLTVCVRCMYVWRQAHVFVCTWEREREGKIEKNTFLYMARLFWYENTNTSWWADLEWEGRIKYTGWAQRHNTNVKHFLHKQQEFSPVDWCMLHTATHAERCRRQTEWHGFTSDILSADSVFTICINWIVKSEKPRERKHLRFLCFNCAELLLDMGRE